MPPHVPAGIAGMLMSCGVGLVLLGSSGARQFGAAAFVLGLGYAYGMPRAAYAARRTGADVLAGRIRRIVVAVWNWAVGHWRPAATLSGAFFLLGSWAVGDGWPDIVRIFYVCVGGLLIGSAMLARRWDPGRSSNLWRAVNGVAVASGMTAVGLYVGQMIVYGLHVPFWDDFIANFPFAVDFDGMNPFDRKEAFLRSHYGHIIGTTHALTLAQLKLLGELDFFGLMVAANAFLFAGIAVLYMSLRAETRSAALFAPFLLLLLHPQYYAVTLYGFSIANLSVVFFSIATFYLLDRRSTVGFWLATACAIASAFSFGSGILLAPIGLAILLGQGRTREATYWVILMSLVVLHFFMYAMTSDAMRLAQQSTVPGTPFQKIRWAVGFLGTPFTLGVYTNDLVVHSPTFTTSKTVFALRDAAGILSLLGFVYITVRRYWARNITVYGMCLLIVLTAAATAQSRTLAYDVNALAVFASRYTIFPALLAGLLYLALVELHPSVMRWALPFVLVGTALFNGFSYATTLPFARQMMGDARFPFLMYSTALYGGESMMDIRGPFFDTALLARAQTSGAYRIPEQEIVRPFETTVRVVDARGFTEAGTGLQLTLLGESADAYVFAVSSGEPSNGQRPVVLLIDGETATAVETRALEELPLRVEVAKMNLPAETTHLACVRKGRLSGVSFAVALGWITPSGGRFSRTAYRVPTVHPTRTVLRPTTSPVLVHEVYPWRSSVPQAQVATVAPRGLQRASRIGVAPYFAEFVVRPLAPMGIASVDLCWFGKSNPRQDPAVRFLYGDGHFRLQAVVESTWKDLAVVAGEPTQWFWVGLAVEDNRMVMLAAPLQDSMVVHAAEATLPAPLTGEWIQIVPGRTLNGFQGVEILEMRVSAGAQNWTERVQAGPVVAMP